MEADPQQPRGSSAQPSRYPGTPLLRLGLFLVLYALGARLGGLLVFPPEQVSAMWPPSGVALAALLLSPPREWPVMAAAALLAAPVLLGGSFLAPNLTGFVAVAGTLLETLVGAFLLRRVVGFHPSLDRVRDVLGLVVFAALGSPALAATNGVTLLWAVGRLHPEHFWTAWRVFWVGDAMGVLVVAPLLLTWTLRRRAGDGPRHSPWELAALLAALGVATFLAFRAPATTRTFFHPLSYLAFPFVVWAALRFEARGAAAATAVLSAVSLWLTTQGSGPFAGPSPNLTLAFLQSFLAAVSVSGLLLASALEERRHAQDEASHLNQELRQSLRTLAATQAELVRRERMAALGELSATVAHEVRNPLGAIANALAAFRRLQPPPANSDASTLLGVMDEEVNRLDLIVNDLLDFARPLAPRLHAQTLEPLVDGALAATLRTGPPGITVARELDATLPPIAVDAHLLHVAFTNLFSNALQAMPEGGTLSVRLASDSHSGAPGARLSVADTGHGIPPEVQARIFEPFFTTRATGTGLGLAIVRRIVESHHGTVTVHSTVGQGTTFTLWLPYASEAGATA